MARNCPKCNGPLDAGDESCPRCNVTRKAERGLEFIQGVLAIGFGVVLIIFGLRLFGLVGW